MQTTSRHDQSKADVLHDAELANLYGGLDGAEVSYPLLVEPRIEVDWDEDSELDALIFAGLMRIGP
jgi:hypothetical protein